MITRVGVFYPLKHRNNKLNKKELLMSLLLKISLCLLILVVGAVVGYLVPALQKHRFRWTAMRLFRDEEVGVEGWVDESGQIEQSWMIHENQTEPKWAGRLPKGYRTRVFVVEHNPHFHSKVVTREVYFDGEEIAKSFKPSPPFPVSSLPQREKTPLPVLS